MKSMKINKLNYKAYGKLENIEVELHPELTVIFGNNEAGKSTIFNSISTLLYGFRPASREKHPYSHWYKNEINYSGIIQKESELFIVERRLMSMPKLTITALASNTTRNLRNEALSFLPNVSENLYDAVFHLTADDLNRADKDSWEQIQEKLIFNYGTAYLNKTSDVMKRLEQDINAIWRKDKKGNPEMNLLTSELLNLKHERNSLEEQNEHLKRQTVQLDQLNEALIICQTNRHETLEKLQALRSKLPQKELKDKVKMLMNSLYKADSFNEMDGKLVDQYDHLSMEIQLLQDKIKRTESEIHTLKGTLNPLSSTCMNLIQFKPSARQLEQTLNQLLAKEHEEHINAEERIKVEDQIGTLYKFLFESQMDINPEIRAHLKQIKVLDLMSFIQNHMDGQKKNELVAQQLAMKNQNSKVMALSLIAIGIIAVIIGIFLKPVALIGFGFIGYGLAKLKPSNLTVDTAVDLRIIEENIRVIMGPLNLPEYVYKDISLRFFSKLEQLVIALIESERLRSKSEALLKDISDLQHEMSEVLNAYQIDVSSGVVLSFQFARNQIDTCEAQKNEEDRKQIKIDNLNQLVETDYKTLESLTIQKMSLQTIFETFGDGFFDVGFEKFKENLEILKKISIYSDEIDRMPYNEESLEDISQAHIDTFENKRMQLEEDEKALLMRRSDLKNEIARLRENRSMEDVTSEILVAQETYQELEDKRNTLMLLMEIIKYSDDRFRLENQPDIITKVSAYMRQMTEGKYSDVMISESYELQFLVDGELLPLSRAFSKGTIQQLFFAYRLAVIDALDPENELPLVLDEILVNWDANRLNETLKLLSDIARKRQIIFFTCHLDLVEKFKHISNAKVHEVRV